MPYSLIKDYQQDHITLDEMRENFKMIKDLVTHLKGDKGKEMGQERNRCCIGPLECNEAEGCIKLKMREKELGMKDPRENCDYEEDMVNSPSHYRHSNMECIEAMEGMLGENLESYLAGTCLKYLWRYNYKNGIEDLEKCKWYLERLINEKRKSQNR